MLFNRKENTAVSVDMPAFQIDLLQTPFQTGVFRDGVQICELGGEYKAEYFFAGASMAYFRSGR